MRKDATRDWRRRHLMLFLAAYYCTHNSTQLYYVVASSCCHTRSASKRCQRRTAISFCSIAVVFKRIKWRAHQDVFLIFHSCAASSVDVGGGGLVDWANRFGHEIHLGLTCTDTQLAGPSCCCCCFRLRRAGILGGGVVHVTRIWKKPPPPVVYAPKSSFYRTGEVALSGNKTGPGSIPLLIP